MARFHFWPLLQERLWVDYWGNLLLVEKVPTEYLRSLHGFIGGSKTVLGAAVEIELVTRGRRE